MPARPTREETNAYYYQYIDLVPEGDIREILQTQREETLAFLKTIPESRASHRYEPDLAVTTARAGERAWSAHVDEFAAVRGSTLALFGNMADDAWTRRGIASDYPFSVRSLAYIAAGHVIHHTRILKERYL